MEKFFSWQSTVTGAKQEWIDGPQVLWEFPLLLIKQSRWAHPLRYRVPDQLSNERGFRSWNSGGNFSRKKKF